jgi:hypothetical protein
MERKITVYTWPNYLHKLAFAAEISLAKARKDDSEIRIKNKEELIHALTNKETFDKIFDQRGRCI